MKIKRSTIIISLLAVSCLVAALYLAPYLLERLFDLDTYKAEILAQVEKNLNRKVLYEKGEFTLINGPAFSFTSVTVSEKDNSSNFVTAGRVTINVSLFHLMEGDIVLSELKLEKPSMTLVRYPSGELNISDLLTEKRQGTNLNIRKILLSAATIHFSDLTTTHQGSKVTLSETDLKLDHLVRGKKSDINMSGTILTAGMKSPVSIDGTFRIPAEKSPLDTPEFNLKLQADNLMPGHFWSYYSHYLPFKKISGMFDLDLTMKGTLAAFTSAGEIQVSGLRFEYPQVFHSVLTPVKLHIGYTLERTPTAVKVNSISVKVDNLKVKGSCDILDIHTSDPRITAKATTSTFRLEEFRGYIPYGIIVKDTADFIEQHIMGGVFRLDEGSLDGRISQILHMEKDPNYNILHILARVEQGLVTYGDSVPSFNSIKGGLEMKGKDFILHGVKARFGTSPFTLEGRITDYPLVTPCTYPFTMVMKPMQQEISWLMGASRGKALGFSGDSTLNLSGSGYTSRYTLSGDWDLSTAAYSYADLINKPAGRSNSASFSGVLTKEEMKLTSLRYTLSPLVLSMAANYRYAGSNWLGMDLKTNRFTLQEIAPMIPMASRYQPTGILQATLTGESSTGDPADLTWKGNMAMAGCSFKPPAQIKQVSALNGTLRFSGSLLETSQLSVAIGSSTIQGKGSMSGFRNPSINLTFSSRLLDPVDLGLVSPIQGMKISNLAGTISLKENDLQIAALSGQINKTVIALKGSIRNLTKGPNADISLTSPYLDVDDILLLTALKQEKGSSSGPPPTVKASIAAESVHALGIPFEKFKGSLLLENKILYIQPLEALLAGGKLTGNVRVDTGQSGPGRRIQTVCRLENASAEKLMHALGVEKSEIRGTVNFQGEISAKGDSSAEIKKSALGTAKIRIEDGSLKRLSTLSKIFSILNVSQLMKFQLPDMVKGGMPFNKLTGNFAIKDGIVSTSDLYMDSDAINMSAVGSYNLYKDELDTTVGAKPLQTIDKVVSHIPIVGWVLTGKDKSLVTAYFEVKGKLDNPEVKAIPVKGMAKGVFDIFRRIFELPARLITDTGEVIVGK